jgi:integrase
MIVPKYCDFRAFYDHDLAGAIPRVALRDLRHNNATLLLLAGAHPKVAQERLGHSTVSTTLDLYSHVTMQEGAARCLDVALWDAIKAADERT